ncbi:hypothetical protein BP5796_11908 [Coleophoma crateriformis]|uniref:Uncharacterized protein n=1 Tax=Coleophoma crateriformis TaxID=565419 RepID=A0A3D8QEM8_9HELO|nr:hypothetical protein BP5796_11908 [Coleophoma crateriformis]
MPFAFVDNNTAIDHAARRKIRSHVARGRNAGKTVVRPSRKKAETTAAALVRASWLAGETRDPMPLLRQVGDRLSVVSFPEQPTEASKSLVQRAFAFISGPRHIPELSNALDTTANSASMWVQFMFLDEAYFHCAVAVSVTALNNLVIKQEDPIEAVQHISHAFRLINAKLSGDGDVSDTTIAAVIIMSQYERLQGQYRQGVVHLEGLQRMVELRGGISKLTKNKPGADLEFSLHLGSETRFHIEDIAYSSSTSSMAIFRLPSSFRRQDDLKPPEILHSRLLARLSANLQDLLVDMTNLAWLLNDASAGYRPKVHGYTFQDAFLQLGYRIVDISPLGGPRPSNRLENAVHLGLTAFFITLFCGLDYKMMKSPLLNDLARSAAQEPFDGDQENQEVLLWLLFIGGAAVFRQPDDAWLTPKTIHTMQALDLHTWDDVRQMLAKFPWVTAIHDKAGRLQTCSQGHLDYFHRTIGHPSSLGKPPLDAPMREK